MHHGDRILQILFVLIWVIALLHVTAEFQYWYWTYRWLDIPMHFVGGVWVGLAAVWLRYHSGHLRKKSSPPTRPLMVALVGGIAFGLVWELYEFLVWTLGGVGLPPQYIPDSSLDLVMDMLGAFVGYGIYRRFARPSDTSTHTTTVSTSTS